MPKLVEDVAKHAEDVAICLGRCQACLRYLQLEFRDVISNKSYAQLFIHVKITSSKTMRFATIVNIGKPNERVI